jgi:hypothetical protein
VSDVNAGTIMTLVVPLSLLMVVFAWWWLVARQGRRTRE